MVIRPRERCPDGDVHAAETSRPAGCRCARDDHSGDPSDPRTRSRVVRSMARVTPMSGSSCSTIRIAASAARRPCDTPDPAHRRALHTGTLGKTAVTLSTHIADAPPVAVPAAADPAAGTPLPRSPPWACSRGRPTHPNYSDSTDLRNWNDTGRDRARPAGPGDHAGHDRATRLSGAVASSRSSPRPSSPDRRVRHGGSAGRLRPQKPTPMSYPLIRRVTTEPGQKLRSRSSRPTATSTTTAPVVARASATRAGPAFLNGYLVGDTSYGYTLNCRYLDGYQRVDIESIQTWLATFEGLGYLD